MEADAILALEKGCHAPGRTLFPDFVEQLIEMSHSPFRIRSRGQKARELSDQGNGRAKARKLLLIVDLLTAPVGKEHVILDHTGVAPDSYAVNVDLAERQSARQRVEKGGLIRRLNLHDRPVW